MGYFFKVLLLCTFLNLLCILPVFSNSKNKFLGKNINEEQLRGNLLKFHRVKMALPRQQDGNYMPARQGGRKQMNLTVVIQLKVTTQNQPVNPDDITTNRPDNKHSTPHHSSEHSDQSSGETLTSESTDKSKKPTKTSAPRYPTESYSPPVTQTQSKHTAKTSVKTHIAETTTKTSSTRTTASSGISYDEIYDDDSESKIKRYKNRGLLVKPTQKKLKRPRKIHLSNHKGINDDSMDISDSKK